MKQTGNSGQPRDRFADNKRKFYPETAADFVGVDTPGFKYDSHLALSISPNASKDNFSFAKVFYFIEFID